MEEEMILNDHPTLSIHLIIQIHLSVDTILHDKSIVLATNYYS